MTPKTALDLLLQEYRDKASKALDLYLHSARKVAPFDPGKIKTPEDSEPYDALAGRFERAIEMVTGPLFRAIEAIESSAPSESARDRLNLAAKWGLLEDVELWVEMRAARNRIAHDYLPERLKALQDLLRTRYKDELEKFRGRVESFLASRGLT